MSDDTITAGKVVGINYTLTDDEGTVLDTNAGGEPLAYLHGHGQIVAGLEKALEGQTLGNKVQISVPPEEGYGPSDPERRFDMPRDRFDFDVKAGDVVQAQLPDGQAVPLQVLEVKDDAVTLDGNHPLAGKTLNFDVEVINMREATAEELDHGHSHDDHDHN
jgi:FKBP-type peptidyl-prolyl cis-trans isomerase SlyD